MIGLDEVAYFLDGYLATYKYADDQGGVFRPSTRSIRRLGLALEPWTGLATWAGAEHLDALFLHRPWRLQPGQLAEGVGVISYHLAFDERLTLGFNRRLASALGMVALEELGQKDRRTIGMLGATARQPFDRYRRQVYAVFGGLDDAHAGTRADVRRVAVVGTMADELVVEAAERGVDVYITGQYRQPAQPAVQSTGIGVIVVGHTRAELWGLRALAGVLRERWAGLEVVFAPSQ